MTDPLTSPTDAATGSMTLQLYDVPADAESLPGEDQVLAAAIAVSGSHARPPAR